VTQRDLLILLAHFVLADAHLGEDEMRAAESHFRVTGDGKFDALAVVANDLLDDRRNGVLTRLVDVVKAISASGKSCRRTIRLFTMPGV
jgi:hypothetical protein